jgi:hypothetical protein
MICLVPGCDLCTNLQPLKTSESTPMEALADIEPLRSPSPPLCDTIRAVALMTRPCSPSTFTAVGVRAHAKSLSSSKGSSGYASRSSSPSSSRIPSRPQSPSRPRTSSHINNFMDCKNPSRALSPPRATLGLSPLSVSSVSTLSPSPSASDFVTRSAVRGNWLEGRSAGADRGIMKEERLKHGPVL